MTFKNVLASAAALGVALTPVAATAGTNAGASLPAVEAGSIELGQRATTGVKKEEQFAGGAGILAILAAAAVIVGIIIALDDDDDRSPGS